MRIRPTWGAVVAEGVENQAICDRLAGLGCDVAQGYCISAPIPAE
jgi:EAL domain-containing protein (putative c-di-GMP-specific phosphodiesterase class I)